MDTKCGPNQEKLNNARRSKQGARENFPGRLRIYIKEFSPLAPFTPTYLLWYPLSSVEQGERQVRNHRLPQRSVRILVSNTSLARVIGSVDERSLKGISNSLRLPAPKGAEDRLAEIEKLGVRLGSNVTVKGNVRGMVMEITPDGRIRITGLEGFLLPSLILKVE